MTITSSSTPQKKLLPSKPTKWNERDVDYGTYSCSKYDSGLGDFYGLGVSGNLFPYSAHQHYIKNVLLNLSNMQ
jgi:hypothetical protein